MKIPRLSLMVISILSFVVGCKGEALLESQTSETDSYDALAVRHDRELVSLILDSEDEQRSRAISEFRRRIDQGEFDFDDAMPVLQRDQLIPIFIEEIEENVQLDISEAYDANDAWWVLISLQARCMKPDKAEWRDWWLNDKETIFWTYSSHSKEKKKNKPEMATPRKPSD